ncbi:FG-GAP-like repeat-containing protein [Streptomyces sp. NBC_00201]|uniref:FG-GAP-like repeat-containing protein n=1 Tax=unclassified Streptomyces TaxID=2593676 RepID=UPI002252C8F4|nr:MULTISPECIES: FG-GAP-like repeat-containing protein [unclassified Streptomyces]MCX5060339.1 FG-GAP-like repeat-containing protein [Streptomyces sp. NBC_00452]MCX5247821.1 FG-GAP-like repeat-containing protein [Streptomyces sp. NBC_00201]
MQLPTRGDTFGICAAIAASTLVLATASPASAHTPRSYATTRTVPTVSSPVSASPARTTTAHDASPAEAWTSAAAEKFWTPQRMAQATPDSPRGGAPAGWRPASTVNGAAAARNGSYFAGVPTVGTFFHYVTDPATDKLMGRFCSASVVDSPQGNVILTAAHCSGGSKGMFVPRYDGAATNPAPYGRFAVQRWIRDARWYQADGHPTRDAYSDFDYAFARVADNKRGQNVQKAVGAALKLGKVNGQYKQNVTVIGYPGSHNPKNRPFICAGVGTRQLPGYHQMRMDCGGFYGGTSGSPWITGLNERTGSGTVIGNLGGYFGGGLENNSDRISFAATYDQRAFEIYDAAKRNTTPRQYPRGYSMYPTGGGVWQHAMKTASGDYTGDGRTDMIAIWSDGEVTLYIGNGNGGFSGERRIAKSSTWTHAKTIAGGDFNGDNVSDLMVVWSDGEVTLYTGDGNGGFANETQMAKPGSTWKDAVQITAGRYSANQWTDDLMVRWADGETTLYTDVDSRGFLHENKLKSPNDTWRHATVLAAGNFTGGANWDVIVRWSDGELTLYRDSSASGVGTEIKLKSSNKLWTHATVMTAGAYTPGDPNDLLVRWSDGETTLYTDTTTTLGREHVLVPPKAS